MPADRKPPIEDLDPIFRSLPVGAPAPIFPILLQWTLVAASGASLVFRPEAAGPQPEAKAAGVACAVLAGVVALTMLRSRSVVARSSAVTGLLVSAFNLAVLLGTR